MSIRKHSSLIMLCVLYLLGLAACGKTAEPAATTEATDPPSMAIGNPWVEYSTLADAEDAVGFDFPLEETVEGSYIAESFRVCNGKLLEVVYRDDTFLVTVRMQAGEHEDISGNYNTFDHAEPFTFEGITGIVNGVLKHNDGDHSNLKLMTYNGYSYSFDAPNGYWGDSSIGFSHFYGAF